jgi:hypothetical protein
MIDINQLLIAKRRLFTMAGEKIFGVEVGSDAYEKMIDFMRKDLESGMGYTKLEMEARKIIEARGGNFDQEFAKWKKGSGV